MLAVSYSGQFYEQLANSYLPIRQLIKDYIDAKLLQ